MDQHYQPYVLRVVDYRKPSGERQLSYVEVLAPHPQGGNGYVAHMGTCINADGYRAVSRPAESGQYVWCQHQVDDTAYAMFMERAGQMLHARPHNYKPTSGDMVYGEPVVRREAWVSIGFSEVAELEAAIRHNPREQEVLKRNMQPWDLSPAHDM